jgi:hypothetical protein
MQAAATDKDAVKGQFSIPRELFRMAEYIYSRGLKEARRRASARTSHGPVGADRASGEEGVTAGAAVYANGRRGRVRTHSRRARHWPRVFPRCGGRPLPRCGAASGCAAPDVCSAPVAEGSTTAVHSMVSTLLAFMEALPEPVIPFAFYQKCMDNNQTPALARQVRRVCAAVRLYVCMSVWLCACVNGYAWSAGGAMAT